MFTEGYHTFMSHTVSVIIPVPQPTPELQEALMYLHALHPPATEILVLPNDAEESPSPRVRYVPTGRASAAEKRDHALTEAHGDILAFLDDDAYPRSDWLQHAARHFDDLQVAAVGGPAITPPQDGFWAQLSGAVFTSWFGSGPARMRYWPVGSIRTVDDWPSVNLLVRRSVFAEIGGFGTAVWPGEDTKLCLEIVRRGYRIIYDPTVVVYHHRATTPLRHLRQVARYGLHRGYFVRAFPETSRRASYFLPLGAVLAAVLALAGALFVPALRVPVSILMLFVGGILFFIGIVETRRSRRVLIGLCTPPLLVLTHCTYALAFLRGLFSPSLKRYARTGR